METVDISLNWRQAGRSYASREDFPHITRLTQFGMPPLANDNAVLVHPSRFSEGQTVLAIRDWLREFNYTKYRLFGRFSWESIGLRVVRKFDGLVVQFEDFVESVMFRFRWDSYGSGDA